MIDTICLLIPKSKIAYPENISTWESYSKTDHYTGFVLNPNKKEKETGKYFPRLTGYRRKFSQDASVKIEFSVSKLIYLNNLDELEDKDFRLVINTLQERLKTMGVEVARAVLEKASVCSVHFSKNLVLQDGYTVNHLISEMNKIDLRKSFDFTKTRFINDGQSLYLHATSHQLVIYDKIADLNKNKKRAIDKDQTLHQKNLFLELNKREKSLEIIRFEIRLSHKQKMNKVLEGLGYQKNPTFKDVFNTEVSQKVVNNYWKKLIRERNLGLFSLSTNSKDILQTLFLADKTLKPKQAIYLLGLFMLAKDENGMRQLRTILTKKSHDRTWYRITKDVQEVNTVITENRLRDWVKQIDKGLDDYSPYKHKKMLND